jgi:RNA polymerase sigma-70 factor (ECF subfamily)
MSGEAWLAERFEANRGHLRAVAYRMLGSAGEADDAVQECWLRLSRTDTRGIENLEGWLTTVVARVCLDMLRSRKARREELLSDQAGEVVGGGHSTNPEQETLLAESVGLALLVVLERLAPAERLAFVLHDIFALPFEEIGRIAGRSPSATRQLASRARRRVHGLTRHSEADISRQRKVVDKFLAAIRSRDMAAVLEVLDPEVVRRGDAAAAPATREIRGAEAVAREALAFADVARHARAALVNGSVGVVVAPDGKLKTALRCGIEGDRIVEMEVLTDPERLRELELGILDEEKVSEKTVR